MKKISSPSVDLVYARYPDRPSDGDDLIEIGFEDMEPVESFDMVGIEPYTAVAILPFSNIDILGIPPFAAVACTPSERTSRQYVDELGEDAIQTEEFHEWSQESTAANG